MSDEGKSRAELIAEFKRQEKPDLGPAATTMRAPAAPQPSTLADLTRRIEGVPRFQYAVVNVGTFNNAERMQATLASAGAAGWELVTVYDKASNWIGGWEKGFLLLKREVPEGATPESWCLLIRQ